LAIATAARRFKSERSLSLGSELGCLQLETGDAVLSRQLTAAIPDLVSVTRARSVEVVAALDPGLVPLALAWEGVRAGLHVG
jgi:hypothetical protein